MASVLSIRMVQLVERAEGEEVRESKSRHGGRGGGWWLEPPQTMVSILRMVRSVDDSLADLFSLR